MRGTLTFLGTGTSMGVPTVGCSCAVCTSTDPRDQRLRPSVLVRWTQPGETQHDRVVVIDTGPDFRQQALRHGIDHVDAVLYTHGHADHILGMDDLRPLSFVSQRAGGPIPLYASPETAAVLKRVYDYTFLPTATYATRARVEIHPLGPSTMVHGVEFLRVPVQHGEMEVFGFRFGDAAYLTDVSYIPDAAFPLLEGLETLVLPALRHKPHPSHATLQQAVEWAQRIGARRTWLTHIAHELGHEATNAMLPPGIALAYDGLEVEVNLGSPAGDSNGAHSMVPVYRGIRELPEDFGPCVGAIGNFDGVHRGHQQILSGVVAEARRRGTRAVAITFDPHPEQFLRPKQFPGLLTPMDHRLSLLAQTGVDAIVVLIFDEVLSKLSAREFVDWVLGDALGVCGLHEGGNFRFGHRAKAGVRELMEFSGEFGFSVDVHSSVRVHGLEVSSSAIREAVMAGDMRRARWMLGRPFSVRGTQQRDRGIGTKLLVPTVNLAPYTGLLPANGVYVTRLRVAGRCFQAVTNVGNRPTFEGAGFSVETHILDFEPVEMDADTPLELEFLLRLREEKRFDSTEELKAQILRDVTRAKRYFRLASS